MDKKELIKNLAISNYEFKTGIKWDKCAKFVQKAWLDDTRACIEGLSNFGFHIGTIEKNFTEVCRLADQKIGLRNWNKRVG